MIKIYVFEQTNKNMEKYFLNISNENVKIVLLSNDKKKFNEDVFCNVDKVMIEHVIDKGDLFFIYTKKENLLLDAVEVASNLKQKQITYIIKKDILNIEERVDLDYEQMKSFNKLEQTIIEELVLNKAKEEKVEIEVRDLSEKVCFYISEEENEKRILYVANENDIISIVFANKEEFLKLYYFLCENKYEWETMILDHNSLKLEFK